MNRPSPSRGWLKNRIAQGLILVLVGSALPRPASAVWVDNSGNLPGIVSGKVVAAAAIATGAVVVLGIYYLKKRKGGTPVKLEAPPARFSDVAPGHPTKETVPVTNIMSVPVTVKEVTVDDTSRGLSIGDARPAPFTLAPGEKFDIPVTVCGGDSAGTSRLRIVVATETTKKDQVKFVNVSCGQRKSRFGKLIP